MFRICPLNEHNTHITDGMNKVTDDIRNIHSTEYKYLMSGAEAWRLDAETRVMLNGANAQMLTHITNKTVQEEKPPLRQAPST